MYTFRKVERCLTGWICFVEVILNKKCRDYDTKIYLLFLPLFFKLTPFLLLQVMMMVLPLLIIVLLPKVVNTNDPEMRKVRSPAKPLRFPWEILSGQWVHHAVSLDRIGYLLTSSVRVCYSALDSARKEFLMSLVKGRSCPCLVLYMWNVREIDLVFDF